MYIFHLYSYLGSWCDDIISVNLNLLGKDNKIER